ncbi:hypothetical protein DBV05_g10111 [Lasiodiplodia theobromae]|uniref:Uncharacterized protein n=1 Tax=Lasiodiplodia theobromae TaxID=45133 RepID=A0A5N5D0S7_9PEZI|nr:hypothetical protein DBV05_g10111 [Lasiodiplodia theobromae]
MDVSIHTAQYANGSVRPLFSTMEPIKELERTDADIYVAFLSFNTILFSQESDDLWYPAHEYATDITSMAISPDDTTPTYWSDEVTSPMGLVLQHQLCKPHLPANIRCTPLSSLLNTVDAATRLWPKSELDDNFEWFVAILEGAHDSMMTPIKVLGPAALDSKSLLSQGLMGPLASNQWQRDVTKWFNISLATIQQNFVDVAAGSSEPSQESFLKILSTAYINFPVFGLATILIVGGLIIIISYTIEPFTVWIQRRRNLDVYARLEWTMNETFQLQRLAHEELGVGTWVRCNTDVPVTERLERLGVVGLSDRTHPKLVAPPPAFEELLAEEGEAGKRDSDQSQTGSGESCARQKEARAQVSAAAGAECPADDSPGGGRSPAPSGVTQG